MKKIMPPHQKNIKQQKTNKQLNEKSFLKMSKSEIFIGKKHKKSISIEKQHKQLSKNDFKVPIYTDNQGFIVEYSNLVFGLKCECHISENAGKKQIKLGVSTSQNLIRQNSLKRKIKLQITLTKNHIAIIKGGVQHIFPLPEEQKHNFLKIVLIENWQIQQFLIPNKKIKICDGQVLSATKKGYDQIYVLDRINEADQLRKTKLAKSDSKIKIAWCNTPKQSESTHVKNIEKLSFNLFNFCKKNQQMSRSMIVEPTIQPGSQLISAAFLRKSFNQNDKTRDSQQEQIFQERHFQKKGQRASIKINKTLSINLNLWNQDDIFKNCYEGQGRLEDLHQNYSKKPRKDSNH